MNVFTIVGLGNPGFEYEGTRHNVGFMVVDALCEMHRSSWRPGKGGYLISTVSHGGSSINLAKPLTYMNNSGLAVVEIVERYSPNLSEMLVVCDDITLPLGRLRVRRAGSDGGHNGLYSIIYHLGTEEFPRLRCGIGPPEDRRKELNATEFVLSNFEKKEKPSADRMVSNACGAILTFATEGIEAAMARWNAVGKNTADDTEISVGSTVSGRKL